MSNTDIKFHFSEEFQVVEANQLMWDKDILINDENWHMGTYSSAPYIMRS